MADPHSSAKTVLSGWYVISLRPVADHDAVRRAVTARGARLFALSPLRLAPRQDSRALARALAQDTVIFTSPAAVRFAAARDPLRPVRGAIWCAVGAGTAAALRRAGVDAVTRPERMDSEGLLALPALATVRGARIGLVTAPGGRGLIAERLRERGAGLIVAHVYERVPVTIARSRRLAVAALPAPCAVLVSSREAWLGLWPQLDAPARRRLRSALAVVSSAGLAGLVREHGLERIAIADSARPRAMVKALADAAGEHRFR